MSSSVFIDAPGKHAWNAIENARRWPLWSTVCTEVWNTPDNNDWQVGHRFGFKLNMARREVPFNVSVTRFESGKLIEWASTKLSITAVRTISVEHSPNGCLVSDAKQFSSSLLPIRLAYPRLLIRRMTESWLADLKREAESN